MPCLAEHKAEIIRYFGATVVHDLFGYHPSLSGITILVSASSLAQGSVGGFPLGSDMMAALEV